MKILIVEDDPVSRALLEKALTKMKEEVVTASTGAEALVVFEKERPRIVISDWMMPELSGLELCRRIRSHSRDTYTYVIITTTRNAKEDILEVFKAGADDYVGKPYDIGELYARLNTGKRLIQLEDGHRQLHDILVSSRNKFRTVFDALPEEILTVDQKLKIVSMNRSALRRLSGDFNQYLDTPCRWLTEDGGSDFYSCRVEKMVHACLESGQKQSYLDRFVGSDGQDRIKERTAVPVKDDSGRIDQITFVSRDITKEYRHTEEIKQLNQKLKLVSSELIAKNGKLKSALENLEKTQAKMLQSEKMASIGQLAAGVAHEINNPTGFVSSNLNTLGDYQEDLSRVLADYQELKNALKALPAGVLPDAQMALIARVEATEEEVDIAYIQEDVGELIGDSREGTERIKKIVDDLKQFAHPGEEKMKATDVNAGLESTLNVVNNELKYKATIVKELGEVPLVMGYPQQLNQVFMNLLVNAAQAIEKSGEIKIVTTAVDGMLDIRISDTGCGIPEENLHKIFDPFFTTKDVGEGTGLGMNIAYNIISKHNGSIRAESTVGEGTTFIINLPPSTEEEDLSQGTPDDTKVSV
jgi:signal transduction histidine kinase/DNA-binding response OmpR family regulator